MELIETFIKRKDAIWIAFQEHLFLASVAMVLAIIIAVPLGIVLTRNKKIAEFVIGIAAVIQTIPSLALLGFMLPLFGIGKVPAIIALTLYALLPILRNTYTGIIGVDQSLVDAGKGMGMTSKQILFMVELPLTFFTNLDGWNSDINRFNHWGSGLGNLYRGGWGLGDLIIRGLNVMDKNLILSGAIPAAILGDRF